MEELSPERLRRLQETLANLGCLIDAALDEYLPAADVPPEPIHRAIRYSVFAGGKRLRPILTLLSAAACGGRYKDAIVPACAVEMVHTYSLIHDDLPAMDDDDLRRGKPTNHKVFGEAMAILAGDALLTLAFETIARRTPKKEMVAALIEELSRSSGTLGMVGGQVMDLKGENTAADKNLVGELHRLKTALLIKASLTLGAIAVAAGNDKIEALAVFGENLGLAFQIVDDIMDIEGSTEEAGKAVRKDSDRGKMTYPAAYGIEGAKRRAEMRTLDALKALDGFDGDKCLLRDLAVHMLKRKK